VINIENLKDLQTKTTSKLTLNDIEQELAKQQDLLA
jgi:hypothetical protein